MSAQAIFAALLLLYNFITPSVAVCYHPNGDSADSDYRPCNSNGASMCCALGHTGNTKNYCRNDGLCDSPGTKELWRESCTDPTWQDPACVNLCLSISNSDAHISACEDGSFCCWDENETCCQDGQGIFINGKKPIEKKDNNRLLGLGLGLGLGFPLLFFVGLSGWLFRKWQNCACEKKENPSRVPVIKPPPYGNNTGPLAPQEISFENEIGPPPAWTASDNYVQSANGVYVRQ